MLVSLSDAEAGAQIWSKAYDRRLADLFALQEEIAQAIVGATGGEIIRANAARASRFSPEHLDAWGLLHRAYHFWNHAFSREGLDDALAQARRAVELDPSYAAAHAFLGLYLIQRVIHVLTPRVEEERAEALAAAEKAVELAPGTRTRSRMRGSFSTTARSPRDRWRRCAVRSRSRRSTSWPGATSP